ncbi:hypothetical protein BH11PAT4_BH11PAT4_3630 [soil metagenome]
MMKQCISPFLKLASVLFVGFLFFTFAPTQSAHAAFDPNNLIRDDLFVDANAMDEGSIQAYLESYGSCLASVSPALLDSDIRASALINNAAKQFGISPKVLMTTMQKEQSLLTRSCAQLESAQGMQYALNGAVGYNMPDTLGVGSCLYTFKRQLFGATCNGSDYWGSPRSFRNNWDLGRGQGGTTFPQSFVVQEKSWVPGVNVTINPQTKATGLLYRYTPYVYNGNYNFWNLYHNVFFPPAAYASEYVWQSSMSTQVNPGSSVQVAMSIKNKGYITWNTSGPNAVKLATNNPLNRASQFSSAWPGVNRLTPCNVEKGDSAHSVEQAYVKPGQIVVFCISFSPGASLPTGLYREEFTPILEGIPNTIEINGLGVDVTVGPLYNAAWVGQSSHPVVNSTQFGSGWVKYKNTSSTTWRKTGTNPVRLATARAYDRSSNFVTDNWVSASRPGIAGSNASFTLVEAGDNPNVSQGEVKPGQIATFPYDLKAHAWIGYGNFNEYFTLTQDGSGGYGKFGPDDVYASVTTTPYWQAAWEDQTAFPTVAQGGITDVTIKYRNLGTTTWQNTGVNPVILTAARPSNRSSNFIADSWTSGNKVFSFVSTEAGSDPTITAGQVKPGQIGVFTFPMKAHAWMSTGSYLEYFGLTQDGTGGKGSFGPDDVYVRVTIAPAYVAAWNAQTPFPSVRRGEYGSITIKFANTGAGTWTNTGNGAVMLSTARSFNRNSNFVADSWVSPSRIISFASTEAGSNPTITAGQVKPGQIGVFTFPVKGHSWMQLGEYYEYFTLSSALAPGSTQFGQDDVYARITLFP